MNKIIITLICSVIGAIFYRWGGTNKGTLWRDAGVSAVFCLLLALLGGVQGFWQWLSLIPCFGASWGCLSTYRYFLPKPKDYGFIHYFLHGLFVAAAFGFYAWASGHWLGYGMRVIVCAIGVALWSMWISWDVLEERGRGAIFCLTIPLLLLG